MSTLTRYVLGRTTVRFLGLFAAFVAVLLGGQFAMLQVKGIPPEACLPVLQSTLVLAVSLSLPLALTTAMLLICGAMARDGEIRALAACGISHVAVLRSLVPLALAGVIASAVLSHIVMPKAVEDMRQNQGRMAKAAIARQVARREAITIDDQIRLWARAASGNSLTDLYLCQRSGDKVLVMFSPDTAWSAGSQGVVLNTPRLYLLSLPDREAKGPPPPATAGEVDNYTSFPQVRRSDDGDNADTKSTPEVIAMVRAGPKADGRPLWVYNNARLVLHLRLFMPLSIIVFGLLAAGIGLTFGATDNLIGVLLMVLLVALSTVPAIQFVKTQVDHPHASPGWLLWPPAMLFGLVGAWLAANPQQAMRRVSMILARLRFWKPR